MSEALTFVAGVLLGWVMCTALRGQTRQRSADAMGALTESLASLGAAIHITASVIERAESRISALDARLSAEIAEQNRMRHDTLGRLHTLLASVVVSQSASAQPQETGAPQ